MDSLSLSHTHCLSVSRSGYKIMTNQSQIWSAVVLELVIQTTYMYLYKYMYPWHYTELHCLIGQNDRLKLCLHDLAILITNCMIGKWPVANIALTLSHSHTLTLSHSHTLTLSHCHTVITVFQPLRSWLSKRRLLKRRV